MFEPNLRRKKNRLDSERNNYRMEEKTAKGKEPMKSAPVLLWSSFQTFMLKKKGAVLHLYSKRVTTSFLPLWALSLPSAVYINSPSRSRCRPIKYIHFTGFYSTAHLLSVYEWRPLNFFQLIFKAGFIGTTDAQSANCAGVGQALLHFHLHRFLLLGKKGPKKACSLFGANKLLRQSVSHVASLGCRCMSNISRFEPLLLFFLPFLLVFLTISSSFFYSSAPLSLVHFSGWG